MSDFDGLFALFGIMFGLIVAELPPEPHSPNLS